MYQGYNDEKDYKKHLKDQLAETIANYPIIYKYINIETGIKALTNSTIGFTQPTAFNDPFDCTTKLIDFGELPVDYREYLINQYQSDLSEEKRTELLQTMQQHPDSFLTETLSKKAMQNEVENRGVSCFSTKYDNMLMWAHYADSHKGICIGYNLIGLYLSLRTLSTESMLITVKYKDKFEPVNYWKHKLEAIVGWLSTKSKIWEYEQEVRIMINFLKFDSSQKYIAEIPQACCNSIYLGTNITSENQEKILNLVKDNYPGVQIFKIKPDEENFQLKSHKVNTL